MSEERIRIEGPRVALRAFGPEEFDAAWRFRARSDPTVLPAGMPEPDALRRRIEGSGRLVEGRVDLAIEAEGRLLGEIQTYLPPTRTLPPGVFEVGIVLYDPATRGKGYGTEAFALLTDWLFEHAGARRVQSPTHVTNAAMRRVFQKLGFAEEGMVHDYDMDFVMYGVGRDRWRRGGARLAR